MSDAGVPDFGVGGGGDESEEGVDAPAVSDPVMELENVSVQFDMSRGIARVLDDVSIQIERGEILGVVGESGSGKSMFASAMLDAVVEPGVLRGDITYYTDDGEAIDVLDLSDADLRRFRWGAVAMVFQGAMNSFNPVMTIREHFRDTLEAHDANDEEHMERGYDLLEDLYLEADRVLDSYPHELSGGQKQRALVALSLILEPSVLVMDEPTAALDLLMQRSIIELLTDLQEKYEFTLVFITHDLPLVRGLCDRLGVMYAFELVEVGPIRRVIGNSYHPYTRALLNATPNIDTPLEDMKPIPGESPDPVNVPAGCSYHPRCPLKDQRCEAEDPNLVEAEENHRVACFYWDEVDEAIPLNIPGAEEETPDE
jgi:peptide/nickel transport system ATP-binding protein